MPVYSLRAHPFFAASHLNSLRNDEEAEYLIVTSATEQQTNQPTSVANTAIHENKSEQNALLVVHVRRSMFAADNNCRHVCSGCIYHNEANRRRLWTKANYSSSHLRMCNGMKKVALTRKRNHFKFIINFLN